MENRFLDKLKDNATVGIWSKKTQQEKGDSMTERFSAYRGKSTELFFVA
ncbi:hypothetical protein Goari_000479 [Gossypium aridum]|uniref:Uncharacterized protein n=1 Tax=Gossypium aridum TaxID=34290 RepID=A0A7J8YIE9_GOSAI|nr:hypothetical protein [Gossypium aridum]